MVTSVWKQDKGILRADDCCNESGRPHNMEVSNIIQTEKALAQKEQAKDNERLTICL